MEPEPLSDALDILGDRWTLQVVQALLDGPARFGHLEQAVAGISPNVLSDRLSRLGTAGLLVATPYSTRPPRLTYALTCDGEALGPAVAALAQWAAARGGTDGARHDACGTTLVTRQWCPTCEVGVDPAAVDIHHL